MKIVGIKAENFKKLRVVDMTPPGDIVELTGGNEQGKTSLMDGVQLTLCGLKSRDDIPEPIRHGEDKATFQVTLGESADKVQLVARRVWRKTGTYDFVLENAEGAEYKGPQAMLDKIVGAIALDPGKFGQMDDKKQLETLLKFVTIPIDLKAHAADRQARFDARTAVNRKITDLEGQLKLMEDPGDVPAEEVSTATILEEQAAAQAKKAANDEERQKAKDLLEHLEEKRRAFIDAASRVRDLEAQLKLAKEAKGALDGAVEQAQIEADTAENNLDNLVDPDLTVFTGKLSALEDTNRKVRIKKKRQEISAELTAQKAQSTALTDVIALLDKNKSDALASAKMPIDGLSFDENGVRFRGVPFSQCSSEERLRVSVAMAAAMNPKLKVIFARDASLLDSKHRQILKDFAKENGYQLWMELADDSGKVGIIFEDGSIVPAKKGA